MMENKKEHWETVYETKTPDQVSWTQATPKTSLELIRACEDYRNKSIIDIGGGDSNLIDFLLADGCQELTVLDISAKALDRAKVRLGETAEKVTWIVSDINDFIPDRNYQIWHDRAAFHFLTEASQIGRYVSVVNNWVDGDLIVGTFSEDGPRKCSGLDVTQYSESKMTQTFGGFEKSSCEFEAHITPFQTTQHFIFCHFKKHK
jgi:hypothetical protein